MITHEVMFFFFSFTGNLPEQILLYRQCGERESTGQANPITYLEGTLLYRSL